MASLNFGQQKMPLNSATPLASSICPVRFDTASLPQPDQFEAWRQLNRAAIDLSLPQGASQPFLASMDIWDLDGLVYSRALLPIGMKREWCHWRHNPLDHWCLVLPDPDPMRLGSQIIGFRSLAEPFQGSAADRSVYSLYIPRSLFGSRARALDCVPSTIPDEGLGALLADYILNVYRRLPHLSFDELPRLVEATRMMILACALPSRDRLEAARTTISETMLERARQLVTKNILASHLDGEFLAKRLGLSRSSMYRLFETEGGVERFIRRRRLQNAHATLSDPTCTLSFQMIGELRGFQDAASFSRAFRREFGYSPTEARTVGQSQADVKNRPIPGEFQMLGLMLKRL